MRSRGLDVRMRAASSVDEPGAGVERVLEVQLGGSSSAPTAAAMPPCAYFVLHSSMLPLVRTRTLPCSRAISAA